MAADHSATSGPNRRITRRRRLKKSVDITVGKGAMGLGPNLAADGVELSADGVQLEVTVPKKKGAEIEIGLPGSGGAVRFIAWPTSGDANRTRRVRRFTSARVFAAASPTPRWASTFVREEGARQLTARLRGGRHRRLRDSSISTALLSVVDWNAFGGSFPASTRHR